MWDLSLLSTWTISHTLNEKFIMLRQLIGESYGHFWKPTEFENVANPDFENLKHLQNPGHLFMAKGCRSATKPNAWSTSTPDSQDKTGRWQLIAFQHALPDTNNIQDLTDGQQSMANHLQQYSLQVEKRWYFGHWFKHFENILIGKIEYREGKHLCHTGIYAREAPGAAKNWLSFLSETWS